MNRMALPANWASTANALEAQAFLCKDAVLVIDDFKPQGGRGDIDQLHAKADRVLRGQGNRSGRRRCRPDGTPRPARPPRGLVVSSGEDVPRGESLRARMMLLHVGQGDIGVTKLTPYQKDAGDGLYAQTMAGFLAWLAPRYGEVLAGLPAEHAALRQKAQSPVWHARTPGVVAHLALGLKYFLDFVLQAGAIDAARRDNLAKEGWAALVQAAEDQAADIASQDPARRYLRLLAAVISSGRGHLASPVGMDPVEPERWGWRCLEVGSFDSPGSRWQPQGRCVGWVDAQGIYLDPEAAYAEVQALGTTQGEPLVLSLRQTSRRLKEKGHLVSFEEGKALTRRTLQGETRYVLHLAVGALMSQEQGE
jgi:hypothetical protein